jgi:hypothetical protein
MADLDFGNANAKTVTLSFWVRSSLTGTFGGSLTNDSANYAYPFSYTISSANTWEQKSITITGATAGTWLSTNATGLQVILALGAGSTYSGTAGAWVSAGFLPSATGATSVVGTNGATFYITGVQLEVGTQATTFTTAGGSYGAELALCQRYYCQQGGQRFSRFGGGIALGRASTTATTFVSMPVPMRAFPTLSFTNIGNTTLNGTAASSASINADEASNPETTSPLLVRVTMSGGTLGVGTGYEWESNNNTTTRLSLSAEL